MLRSLLVSLVPQCHVLGSSEPYSLTVLRSPRSPVYLPHSSLQTREFSRPLSLHIDRGGSSPVGSVSYRPTLPSGSSTADQSKLV